MFFEKDIDIDAASSGIIILVINMSILRSINEVRNTLDMTSRTIRYYEQRGLIKTVRDSKTAPRKLDDDNIERLKKIRFLRRIGLSLDEIAEIIDSDNSTSEMIFRKSKEFKAEINALTERIFLIEEVLAAAENGENIYSVEDKLRGTHHDAESLRIAADFTKMLVDGRFSELKRYLNADMKRQPPEFFEIAWKSHIETCGDFISFGEQETDGYSVINKLYYSKLGVIVRVDVYKGIVFGVVLQHLKLEKGEKL